MTARTPLNLAIAMTEFSTLADAKSVTSFRLFPAELVSLFKLLAQHGGAQILAQIGEALL
jgi:hypothetical protein